MSEELRKAEKHSRSLDYADDCILNAISVCNRVRAYARGRRREEIRDFLEETYELLDRARCELANARDVVEEDCQELEALEEADDLI